MPIFEILSSVLIDVGGHVIDNIHHSRKSDEINLAMRREFTPLHGHHADGFHLMCDRCRADGVIKKKHDDLHTPALTTAITENQRLDLLNFCPHCGGRVWPDWSPYLSRERPFPDFFDYTR
ncbi:hypothetical protein Ade02nite_01590 [Paractinoplanes deccanensis]|uniref:Uncharacterized protein n=1 Tax=Paractinoplanes deccanensis TaxID=113561 RepID=A0ABQ3XUU6_9ACTN|nr:hypothetical protein [Actinoplanes deccanensis]GID71518.1 hypothetical protein Ade02nite_01590 [Actinoplanes deccanensis]